MHGSQDPNLLPVPVAKGKDIEARLVAHILSHPPAAPALVYGQTPGSVVQTANGTYTWTCPAGVTTAKIECWGAGTGGNGGNNTNGGFGGGGGEYAAEPAYPVVPGQVYTYLVGNGGTGGTTGNPGQDGTDTIFDTGGTGLPGGVFANGATSYHGGGNGSGAGNTPSGNTVVHPGGSGGGATSTGGGGGGGSAGATGAGGTAPNTGSSTGGAAGGGGAGGGAAGGGGGNNAAGGLGGNTPGAGGGAAGASTAASSGTSSYRLSSSGTYAGSDASGGNANQQRGGTSMWQGGETASGGTYNGTQKSLGIIGGNPAADLSGKTIDSVSIRLEWQHCWYNNGSYVILGYTGFTFLGSSWGGSGINGVKTWHQDSAVDQGGGPVTTDLTGTSLGGALQSGAAKSISLGPGGAYNLSNYGQMYGCGGDNNQNPLITVSWHTGSAPVKAGNGADGKVAITYGVAGVLTQAVQPAAGTDGASNAFAAGYTGQVSAFKPGASPSVPDTWTNVTPPSGWGTGGQQALLRYKMMPTNSVRIECNITASALQATNPLTLFTLPLAYAPASVQRGFAVGTNNSSAGSPRGNVNTGGAVIVNLPASPSYSAVAFTADIPMD
jgi:hypothetical protein